MGESPSCRRRRRRFSSLSQSTAGEQVSYLTTTTTTATTTTTSGERVPSGRKSGQCVLESALECLSADSFADSSTERSWQEPDCLSRCSLAGWLSKASGGRKAQQVAQDTCKVKQTQTCVSEQEPGPGSPRLRGPASDEAEGGRAALFSISTSRSLGAKFAAEPAQRRRSSAEQVATLARSERFCRGEIATTSTTIAAAAAAAGCCSEPAIGRAATCCWRLRRKRRH